VYRSAGGILAIHRDGGDPTHSTSSFLRRSGSVSARIRRKPIDIDELLRGMEEVHRHWPLIRKDAKMRGSP